MSTRDALTIVGTVVGAYFGYPALGYMVGSLVGAAVDPQQIEGPHIGNIGPTTTEYGWPIVRPYGRMLYDGSPIWQGAVYEVATTTEGKGGPEVTEYSARVDALFLMCSHRARYLLRLWLNKKLVFSAVGGASSTSASAESPSFDSIELLPGDEDELPWAPYEAAVGIGKCPAHVGYVKIGIKGLALEGGAMPLVEAELATEADLGPGDVFWLLNPDTVGGAIVDTSSWHNAVIVEQYGIAAPGLYGPGAAVTTASAPARLLNTSMSVPWGPTDDLTLECRVLVEYDPNQDVVFVEARPPGGQIIACGLADGVDPDSKALYLNAGNAIVYSAEGEPGIYPFTLGVSHHVALDYDGDTKTATMYMDGSPVLTCTHTSDTTGWTAITAAVAGQINSTLPRSVAVDGVRFTRRRRRYTSAFTPPTTAPVDDGGYTATPLPADLADVLRAELQGSGVPLHAIDVAAVEGVELVGYKAGTSAKDVCQTMAIAHFFDWRCGATLQLFPLTAAPARTLAWDDLGYGVGEAKRERLAVDRDGTDEVPRVFRVTVRNPEQDYANLTVTYDRLAGSNDVSALGLPIAIPRARAQGIVNSMARRAAHTSIRTQICIDDRHAEIEEGDCVVAPDRLGNALVWRLARRTYGRGVHEYEAVNEDLAAFTDTAPGSAVTDVSAVTVNPPGTADLIIVDAALLRDIDDSLGAYAVADIDNNGRSATLYRSVDDALYTGIGSMRADAAVGHLVSALPAASPYVWDREHVVTVRLTGGTLAGATMAALRSNPMLNVLAVGGPGRWQYLRFASATLTAPLTYALSTLAQGWAGTEHAIGQQLVGDECVLMTDAAIAHATVTNAELGLPRYWKAVPPGRRVSSVSPEIVAIQAERLRPRSPTQPRFERVAGATVARWVRRTRLQIRLTPTPRSTPLGEASERYDVEVYSDAGRTVLEHTYAGLTVPEVSVTDADLAAHGPYLRIYQLSATVGRSQPLDATLPT